ncbi:MAG: RNA polymerase factor sigma-54 [Paracoccaceae bacterium]|nr:RNA polymerase factor sigma-54 [Paracoccaceae bacterium]
MAMKQGLRVSQKQHLALTPSLRSSIAILRMSSLELAEHIKAELAENPVLIEATPERESPRTGHTQPDISTLPQQRGLIEELHAQISLSRAPEIIRNIAMFLAADLSEEGYLSDSDENLAEMLSVSLDQLRQGISLLQKCEPAGIGARDLRECLDLQLAARDVAEETRRLVINNIKLFSRRDWGRLKKLTGLSEQELHRLARLLKSLDPRPGATVTRQTTVYLQPDLRVYTDDAGMLAVELVNSTLPRLQIDQALIHNAGKDDTDAQAFFQSRAERARALIRAINARSSTLLRIGQAIVENQPQFFLQADGPLKPLTRASLAHTLSLHPSTVTRALAGKALECSRGVFPLGFFFPNALKALDGEGVVSSAEVQKMIRGLVARETADSVLSDEDIVTLLRESGVDIARRTVAKYRQCLNIPTSFQRRRSKRNL